MNAEKIHKLMSVKCPKSFYGLFARDCLPARLPKRRPLLLICNTDPHHKPGEHWIAIYIASDHGEYFDSFGEPPVGIFERFLNRFVMNWTFNAVHLQSLMSQFCGHYCIFYCLFKHLDYNMKHITDCFISDTGVNDWMVHKFVCDLI